MAGAPQSQAAGFEQRAARGPVLLEVRSLGKVFTSGGGQVVALREVNLRVYPGELVVIRGRSGAGKTTLLNLIAGLDDPTSGSVTLFGHDLGPLSDRQRTELRRKDLGVVFQSAHLFPTLTARENVELPLRLVKAEPAERTRRTDEALALVGSSSPAMRLSSVVLPAPERPRMTTNSPG